MTAVSRDRAWWLRRWSIVLATVLALLADGLVFTGEVFGRNGDPVDTRAIGIRDVAGDLDRAAPHEPPFVRPEPAPAPTGTPAGRPETTSVPTRPTSAPPGRIGTSTPPSVGPTTRAAVPTTRPPATSATPAAVRISYSSFSDMSGLALNGSARRSGSALRLTGNQYDAAGSAWSHTAIDARRSFATRFRVLLHDEAEGITFMIQSEGTSAVGRAQSYLGYSDHQATERRIRPSMAVEFDVRGNSWDPNGNHVAIVSNANLGTHLSYGTPSFDLAAGVPFTVWVDYSATKHRLAVYVSKGTTKPTNPLASVSVDLYAKLGERPGYVGFTGSTGDYPAAQDILSWALVTA